jgi:hypothetical protein
MRMSPSLLLHPWPSESFWWVRADTGNWPCGHPTRHRRLGYVDALVTQATSALMPSSMTRRGVFWGCCQPAGSESRSINVRGVIGEGRNPSER